MTKLHEAHDLGQSIWLDYIRRAFIESGELEGLIDAGLRGITSNPSIFEKAITGSADYDDDLADLTESHLSGKAIYEKLAIADIQRAADLLRPIYDDSSRVDGMVSLEADPDLAYDMQGTIEEIRRLHKTVGRPNVMFKVPATAAGIPAIAALIGEGINVNVTLMFSLTHYDAVADAYLRGLERLAADGGDLSRVASVASFFVSRVDTQIDELLEADGRDEALALRGKIGIANAKMAYSRYLNVFSSERWQRLAALGAKPQRVLYGSTSVKNPQYPDTMYVDNLMGPNTVNTLPPATIDAFRDHGSVSAGLTARLDEARAQLVQLGKLGINLDEITQQLQDDGVIKFADAFDSLMAGIEDKLDQLAFGELEMEADLGEYETAVDDGLESLKANKIMNRIWSHDHTVWKEDPTEISNRLGWLHSPHYMEENVERIYRFVEGVIDDGYTDVLLLGMGGSSLAPEVFANIFADVEDGLNLAVLDSTDPGAVVAYDEALDFRRTLFVVATKSGSTAETLSFFKYFYNRAAAELGADETGKHFVAITDPGSKLVTLAQKHNFRATFLNDSTIGGRYSVLSYFGLVPAALVGVDPEELLSRAQRTAVNAEGCNCPVEGNNLSGLLGTILGKLAQEGRDKVTLVSSPELANFGDWIEQLIAESTGKAGKGILPVVNEPLGTPDVYGDDRLFVYLQVGYDDTHGDALEALVDAGQPLVIIHLADVYDIGAQFFLWEMATAVAGHHLGIHPFNQPNVESAKVRAREMMAAYREQGKLPESETAELSRTTLNKFLRQANDGDYIALQAFAQPTEETSDLLETLRVELRDRYNVATTLGYGPRFLHSTGQLHKGDAGNGLFVQFTSDPVRDADIPDDAGKDESSLTFGALKMAQALGDAQALRDEGRRLIRFHLGTDIVGGLRTLVQ